MNFWAFSTIFFQTPIPRGGHSSLQLLRQENHMALADETRTWRISFGTVPWNFPVRLRTRLELLRHFFGWILEGHFLFQKPHRIKRDEAQGKRETLQKNWSLFMRGLFQWIWFFNFQSWTKGAKNKWEFDKGQNRNPLTFCCKWLTYDLLAFFSAVHSYGLWGCNGMRPHTIATCRLNTYMYIYSRKSAFLP